MNKANKTCLTLVTVMMAIGLLTPALSQPASTASKRGGTTVIYRQGTEENFIDRSGSSLQEIIVSPPKARELAGSPVSGAVRATAASAAAVTLAPLDPNWGKVTVNTALAAEILRLTNETRARHGVPLLTADPSLAAAAEGHSTEMLTLGYFSHTSATPRCTEPVHRARMAGSTAARVSENLFQADGYGKAKLAPAALDSWLGSATDRANLLDPRVTLVGLGVVEKDGKVRVTQVFAGGML